MSRFAFLILVAWGCQPFGTETGSGYVGPYGIAPGCEKPPTVDGMFTPDEGCFEYDNAPARGVEGDLYADFDGNTLYAMIDWIVRELPTDPCLFAELRLTTGGGKQRWVVRVFGEGDLAVTLNDVPYEPTAESAAGHGSSPKSDTPHALFEVKLPVASGPATARIAGPAADATCDSEDGGLVVDPTVFSGAIFSGAGFLQPTTLPIITFARQPAEGRLEIHGFNFSTVTGKVEVDGTSVPVVEWSPERIVVEAGFERDAAVFVVVTVGTRASNTVLVDVECTAPCLPECVPNEVCGDGIDNDCDGLTDLEDKVCAEICTTSSDDGDPCTSEACLPGGCVYVPSGAELEFSPLFALSDGPTPPLLEAQNFCAEYQDTTWRLPTIDELRTLITGCEGTETLGACPVSAPGCLSATCAEPACDGCGFGQGPGPNDCYTTHPTFIEACSAQLLSGSTIEGTMDFWRLRLSTAAITASATAHAYVCVRSSTCE